MGWFVRPILEANYNASFDVIFRVRVGSGFFYIIMRSFEASKINRFHDSEEGFFTIESASSSDRRGSAYMDTLDAENHW